MTEDQKISNWGGYRPGAGRPAGTPNKVGQELRAAASQYTEEMLGILVALARDADQPGSVRVAAASQLLDRGHGKPSQSIETKIEKAEVKDMTDAELLSVIQSERAAATAN